MFELARITGTCVRMIEAHYGALRQGSAQAIRARVDALDDRLGQDQAPGPGLGTRAPADCGAESSAD